MEGRGRLVKRPTVKEYAITLAFCNREVAKLIRKEKDRRKKRLLEEIMKANTFIIVNL